MEAKHPDDVIVAVRFPGQQWKRDTRWTLQGDLKTLEKTDRSKLQGQILRKIKADPKLLEVHAVDLYKDHLSSDAIKAVCQNDNDVPVQSLVLAEKVK